MVTNSIICRSNQSQIVPSRVIELMHIIGLDGGGCARGARPIGYLLGIAIGGERKFTEILPIFLIIRTVG